MASVRPTVRDAPAQGGQHRRSLVLRRADGPSPRRGHMRGRFLICLPEMSSEPRGFGGAIASFTWRSDTICRAALMSSRIVQFGNSAGWSTDAQATRPGRAGVAATRRSKIACQCSSVSGQNNFGEIPVPRFADFGQARRMYARSDRILYRDHPTRLERSREDEHGPFARVMRTAREEHIAYRNRPNSTPSSYSDQARSHFVEIVPHLASIQTTSGRCRPVAA